MSWFSNFFGKKKGAEPETQSEAPLRTVPVRTGHTITLGIEAMHVISTLRKLLHPVQRNGAIEESKAEFKKLDEVYTDHVQKSAAPGYFPEIIIEVSEGFYSTWFPKLFHEYFTTHGVNKSDAKEMHGLYRKLNAGGDHPEFLRRYNTYYDR